MAEFHEPVSLRGNVEVDVTRSAQWIEWSEAGKRYNAHAKGARGRYTTDDIGRASGTADRDQEVAGPGMEVDLS